MLRNFAILASALVLLSAPGALAHGEEGNLGHLTVNVHDLAPGGFDTYNLVAESEGDGMDTGPDLKAGWIFTLYGGIQGDGVAVLNLTHGGAREDQWTWRSGAFNSNSTRLQFTGQHELEIRNIGNASIRYAFYFDQSCNCAQKVIPLPAGFVLFNFDFPKGRDVTVAFPTIAGWQVRAKVALLENPRGHWPEDFRILTEGEQAGKGWLNLTFHTDTADRYFVFVDAPKGVTYSDAGEPMPVTLTPLLEVHGGKSPSPSVTALLVAVAVALSGAGLIRRPA